MAVADGGLLPRFGNKKNYHSQFLLKQPLSGKNIDYLMNKNNTDVIAFHVH